MRRGELFCAVLCSYLVVDSFQLGVRCCGLRTGTCLFGRRRERCCCCCRGLAFLRRHDAASWQRLEVCSLSSFLVVLTAERGFAPLLPLFHPGCFACTCVVSEHNPCCWCSKGVKHVRTKRLHRSRLLARGGGDGKGRGGVIRSLESPGRWFYPGRVGAPSG